MMGKIFLFCLLPFLLTAQPYFKHVFKDSTLRIDFTHTGNAEQEWLAIDRFYLQTKWAGPLTRTIDPFNNGKYYVQVYDSTGKTLYFSRGFNSYFGEYQTTSQAKKGVLRTYFETVLIPFPRQTVRLQIRVRDRQNLLQPLFETVINPQKIEINTENLAPDARVYRAHVEGDVHRKVDIVFLSEGYTRADSLKFKRDLRRYVQVLLNKEPFKTLQHRLNIYGVFLPSAEAGCDEPTLHRYKNTVLNCTFNSLGSPRYLLTEDVRALHNLASRVPYESIIVMVNHKRYGGGGIYNFYMTFSTDNAFSENVFIHEFGHSFAGLGDEYYTSSTAYDEFYPQGVEPTEPNLTRLLQPQKLKWRQWVKPGTPIPTPWQKARYDSLQRIYQKKRAEVIKISSGAETSSKIKQLQKTLDALRNQMREILQNSPYRGQVGAFEGAGYVSKGMYRPMLDCVMFSNGEKPFCKVCAQRIKQVILQSCDN